MTVKFNEFQAGTPMQQPFPVINNIGLRFQEEPLEYKQDGGGGWWGKEKGRDNNNNKKKNL